MLSGCHLDGSHQLLIVYASNIFIDEDCRSTSSLVAGCFTPGKEVACVDFEFLNIVCVLRWLECMAG